MIQRGRRWREPDRRWSPAGTTGSLIHLRGGRQRETLNEQRTRLPQRENAGTDRPGYPGRTDCVCSDGWVRKEKTSPLHHWSLFWLCQQLWRWGETNQNEIPRDWDKWVIQVGWLTLFFFQQPLSRYTLQLLFWDFLRMICIHIGNLLWM